MALHDALKDEARYGRAGSVLTIAGREVQALTYTAGGVTPDAAYGTFPNLPVPISYPQTASVIMLTIEPPDYHVQVRASNLLHASPLPVFLHPCSFS